MYKSVWGLELKMLTLVNLKGKLKGYLGSLKPKEVIAHLPADLCGF